MQLTLELTPTQAALLKALSPRGAARTVNSLEKSALRLLVSSMEREARMRRITGDQIGTVALIEAAQRRKERML